MKSIRTVIALGLLLTMGTMQVKAVSVNSEKPEVLAKNKVLLIHNELHLTGDQQISLYEAYALYENDMAKYIADKDPNNPSVIQEKQKLDATLKQTVKNNLTNDQFEQWLGLDV